MMRTMMTILLAGVLAGAPLLAQEAPPRAGSARALGLNLNTATAAQLEALPGIGKAMAERIVEYRQKSGSFKRVEDLMNVRGIGEKAFLKLKPLITVGAPAGDK